MEAVDCESNHESAGMGTLDVVTDTLQVKTLCKTLGMFVVLV